MPGLSELITRRGAATLKWLRGWNTLARFGAGAVVEAMTPSFYNSATRSVVQKQIYFTAWQILPGYGLFAALLSYVIIQIVVSKARDFGLSDYALEMTMRVLVMELLPLVTALFVALRSGAAINTEVALMHIHNEIKALREAGVDPMRFEFVPRVIGGMISVVSLICMSSLVAMVLAYLVVYGWQASNFFDFTRVIAKVFVPSAMITLILKGLAFGLAVTVIPITAGLAAPQKLFFAPISVLQGMVRLFFVLMIIEVASLALQYI